MSEVMKDSAAIKLFGMTILLPYDNLNNNTTKKLVSDISDSEQTSPASSISSTHTKDISVTKHDSFSTNTEETLTEATTSSGIEEPSESSVTEEEKTTLKKPDELLPCPRCKSMDTKFCYFNNYNVNQPRHFCKKCQRYWTAGGIMRNVPVGSGRRKNNKDIISIPNYDQIMVSESINGMHSSSLNTNGFLMFGSENSSPSNSQHLGFPVAFYSATPYCNGPWAGPSVSNLSPINSTLGKHSREGIMITPSQTGKQNLSSLLRIDDPSEAAKRSKSLFTGFVWRRHRNNSNGVMQENPAALSRSLNFRETA